MSHPGWVDKEVINGALKAMRTKTDRDEQKPEFQQERDEHLPVADASKERWEQYATDCFQAYKDCKTHGKPRVDGLTIMLGGGIRNHQGLWVAMNRCLVHQDGTLCLPPVES